MICPKCGADAKRNGGGRGMCANRHSFYIEAGPIHDTSTLTDLRTGAPVLQWVKAKADRNAQREAMEAMAETLAKSLKGLAKPVAAPRVSVKRSLSSYIIGDAHFGLYAWAAEAGEDFDTSIASRDLRAAIDLLVAGAPASETAYLVDVGDFLHADNRSNVTPASGHLLDVDTRFQRVIEIAIDALRYCIARMLQKHKRVCVFLVPGNHNPDSAGWMAKVLRGYYHSDKRVEIADTPSKFHYARFHNNLICMTHGDRVKMADLPSILATDRPRDWGETAHRYIWTGHIHHTKHQEYRGCFVESFNTLAASDAWHHASGYRSARQMQRIDIDADDGIYARGIAGIGRVRNAA